LKIMSGRDSSVSKYEQMLASYQAKMAVKQKVKLAYS
jgi:hypothetical protein